MVEIAQNYGKVGKPPIAALSLFPQSFKSRGDDPG